MRILNIFLCFMSMNSSWASIKTEPLLSYRYGNQITRSHLTINTDGTLEHQEHVCCPPQLNAVPEPKLSTLELELLVRWIEKAQQSPLETLEAGEALFGANYGLLMVVHDENPVVIRKVYQEGNSRLMEQNSSKEARQIEDLVYRFVQKKMRP